VYIYLVFFFLHIVLKNLGVFVSDTIVQIRLKSQSAGEERGVVSKKYKISRFGRVEDGARLSRDFTDLRRQIPYCFSSLVN
jgi:hypothetical protein